MARKRKSLRRPKASYHAACIDHWRLLGVPTPWSPPIPNSMRIRPTGTDAGLFDLLVISPRLLGGDRLHRAQGRGRRSHYTDDQRLFRRLMDALGIPYALAPGRDEPITVLEAWGVVQEGRRMSDCTTAPLCILTGRQLRPPGSNDTQREIAAHLLRRKLG